MAKNNKKEQKEKVAKAPKVERVTLTPEEKKARVLVTSAINRAKITFVTQFIQHGGDENMKQLWEEHKAQAIEAYKARHSIV